MNFEKARLGFSELGGFLRLNISIFLVTTAVIGFLLFNEISIRLLFVMLSSFFLASYTYSFNTLTDREEDFINNGKINKFAATKLAYFINALLVLGGLVFSFLLNPLIFALFVLSVLLSAVYSFFRIKRFFLVKNIYTSLLAIVFLMGATAGGTLNSAMVIYFLLFSLVFFIGSLVSDLRDFKGDAEANLRTVPVVFGFRRTKVIILALISLFLLVVVLFGLMALYLIAFFMLPVVWLVFNGEVEKIHNTSGCSFLLTVLWLLII